MLLKRIKELGFVEDGEELCPIAKFPIDSQKVVISECINVFSETAIVVQKLNLNQAINNVRILGCGLSMPLEEVHLIQQVANILCRWLIDPSQILDNSSGDEVALQLVILEELSGLFGVKYIGDDPKRIAELQQHVDICRKALNAFLLLKFKGGSSESSGFWRFLSCLLIGICDELLMQPVLPYCYLSDELAEYSVSILFELLLREEMFCSLAWSKLKDRFVGWLNRIPVAICWCIALYALSDRLIDIEKDKGVMCVSWRGHLKEFIVHRNFVKFAWYQFAFLVNSPKVSELYPSVLVKLVAGIERVVQLLLPKSQANTLFEVFGKILCQTIFKTGCRDGRANSLSILGQIFGRTSNLRIIRPDYLQIFYACLREALSIDESANFLSIVMIILNAENLLNLPGARILLPELVKGCNRVLQYETTGRLDVKINVDDLHKCTYRLIAQIYVILQHYNRDGCEVIFKMLTDALSQESNCNNVVYLFNILTTISFSSPYVSELIVKKLEQFISNPFECSLAGIGAITCLRGISKLNESSALYLMLLCKAAITRNDLATEGKFIVMLLELLTEKCQTPSMRTEMIKLIALAMGYYETDNDSNDQKNANFVLGREATIQQRQLEEQLKEFAECLIWKLFDHYRSKDDAADEWPHQTTLSVLQ